MMPRLVVVRQEVSDAQKEYQRARVSSDGISNLFYKDATPRADHYVKVTVRLYGREHWPWYSPIPLRLVLCYEDGSPLDAGDQCCLRVLSLSSHVRAAVPAEGDMASFSYRIELGSFRRADRSFVVKIEVCSSDNCIDGLLEAANCLAEPAFSPAVYVLSKKKLADSPAAMSQMASIAKKPSTLLSVEEEDKKMDEVDESQQQTQQEEQQPQGNKRLRQDSENDEQEEGESNDGCSSTGRKKLLLLQEGAVTDLIIHRLDTLDKNMTELTSVIKSFMTHLHPVSMHPGNAFGSFYDQQQQQQQHHHHHHQHSPRLLARTSSLDAAAIAAAEARNDHYYGRRY